MTVNYENDLNFKKALSYILKTEGGYSNNKNDRGGATNFGITQNTYNTFRNKKKLAPQPVIKITRAEAEEIYYENYWCASGADSICDFSIALVLFDSCVNHGLTAGKQLFEKAGNDVEKFLELRLEKYKNIAAKNPSQKIFLKGWINRLNNLKKFIENN